MPFLTRHGDTPPSPIDYELMIRLWLNGSPQSRDVALDMADRDREASRTKPDGRKAA